jgi:hypothetical protein
MKFYFFKKKFLITALACCLFSCSSDLDFEQGNDLNVQPVFIGNLAYINLTASDFILNGTATPILFYTSDVDFLNNSFTDENLLKAELYFRIKNTINRAYTYNMFFLDKNGQPIYNIKMDVPAYNGTDVVVEKTEIFTAANLDVLKNTTKIIFSIRILSNQPINASTAGRVELSSSVTAYFDIK